MKKICKCVGGLGLNIYFAPLEGITGYIYRNAYMDIILRDKGEKLISKFFSPFISPGVNQHLSGKELRDILPENNMGINIIPQLLGCRAEDILLGIEDIKALGYTEVNLNLGCPSGTVVSKKKGAGLLAYTDDLDEFLYKIYEKADIKVSVKTRIGKSNPEEFYRILDIYNKYPMEELIIHPRLQTDFYKNKPDMEMFGYAVTYSKNRLCYNGDITSVKEYSHIIEKYGDMYDCTYTEENKSFVAAVMIGRGFLKNPLLVYEISAYNNMRAEKGINGEASYFPTEKNFSLQKNIIAGSEDMDRIKRFHDRLLADYTEEMSGERPVLFKMKELWAYMGDMFPGSEKLLKKLKKSESLTGYRSIAEEIIDAGYIKSVNSDRLPCSNTSLDTYKV